MSHSSAKPSRVSLVRGESRYNNLRRALDLIGSDIQLDHAQRIVVKPNVTSVDDQLASTHVDALRAVLDFLRERTDRRIVIAEGSGTGSASVQVGYQNFGYLELAKRYDVAFVDLNSDRPVPTEILDRNLRPLAVRLAQTIVEADYLISLCLPKTHDSVIVTASIKNVAVGSLLRNQEESLARVLAFKRFIPARIRSSRLIAPIKNSVPKGTGNDKWMVHQGYQAINLNLYKLVRKVMPHLAVVDGFEAMEGEGPAAGDKVDWGIALASVDPVAADSVTSALMGFPMEQVGYLNYCHLAGLGQGDLSKIDIVGEGFANCARRFRPHYAFAAQLEWQLPDAAKYLI